MPDLSITAANVRPGSAQLISGIAGASLTAGQAVYQNASDQTYKAALSDTAPHAAAAGIVVNNAASGQPISIATGGAVTLGGSVGTVGDVLTVSANAGMLAPVGDKVATEWITILGVVTAAGVLTLAKNISGVQHG